MGNRTERHRPLRAGLKITSSDQGGSGTLTGLATRYADGKRVLVTNLHVMARNVLNPSRTTEMYQVDSNTADDKVGRMLDWVPVRAYVDKDGEEVIADNFADVAIAELSPGVDARFEFQDSDGNRVSIRAGRKDLRPALPLTMVGAESGSVDVVVRDIDETVFTIRSGHRLRFKNVAVLETPNRNIEIGDSGAPCLFQDEGTPGFYRMSAILLGRNPERPIEGWAFPVAVAEDELGIVFGRQNQTSERVTEEGETNNMGEPILMSEGFFGQRWVIDDYFRAGETLHCGDVVVVREHSAINYEPRVYKATSSDDKGRVVGIVHTPDGKVVGDQAATTGGTEEEEDDLVSIVVKGIAKTLSSGLMGVGDPVAASGSKGTPPGKTGQIVAMVAKSSNHSHTTEADGDHSHTVTAVSQGPTGPQGVQGPAGPQGPAGYAGRMGAPGAQGPRGERGPQGEPGLQGERGSSGPAGPEGPQGEKGDKGDPGPQGPPGTAGAPNLHEHDSRYSAAGHSHALEFSTLGHTHTGAQGPQGEKGDKGDPGPRGPQGERGPRGDRGPEGPAGRDGEDGEDGRDGQDGARGPQGERGPRGWTGVRGPKGDKGDRGPRGWTGPQGPPGPRGPSGGGGDDESEG